MKATSWKPREVDQNHLRHIPADRLHLMMGSLGVSPLSEQIKTGKKFVSGAKNIFSYVTDLFGLNKQKKNLQGWQDWDVNDDSLIPVNTPTIVVDDTPTAEKIAEIEKSYEGDIIFDEEKDEIFIQEKTEKKNEFDDDYDKPVVEPVKRQLQHFSWAEKMPECIGPILDQ